MNKMHNKFSIILTFLVLSFNYYLTFQNDCWPGVNVEAPINITLSSEREDDLPNNDCVGHGIWTKSRVPLVDPALDVNCHALQSNSLDDENFPLLIIEYSNKCDSTYIWITKIVFVDKERVPDLDLSNCPSCQEVNAVGTGRVTVNKRKLIKWMMSLKNPVLGYQRLFIKIYSKPIKTVYVEYYFHPITSFRIEFDLLRPQFRKNADPTSIQVFLDENSLSKEPIVEIVVRVPGFERYVDLKIKEKQSWLQSCHSKTKCELSPGKNLFSVMVNSELNKFLLVQNKAVDFEEYQQFIYMISSEVYVSFSSVIIERNITIYFNVNDIDENLELNKTYQVGEIQTGKAYENQVLCGMTVTHANSHIPSNSGLQVDVPSGVIECPTRNISMNFSTEISTSCTFWVSVSGCIDKPCDTPTETCHVTVSVTNVYSHSKRTDCQIDLTSSGCPTSQQQTSYTTHLHTSVTTHLSTTAKMDSQSTQFSLLNIQILETSGPTTKSFIEEKFLILIIVSVVIFFSISLAVTLSITVLIIYRRRIRSKNKFEDVESNSHPDNISGSPESSLQSGSNTSKILTKHKYRPSSNKSRSISSQVYHSHISHSQRSSYEPSHPSFSGTSLERNSIVSGSHVLSIKSKRHKRPTVFVAQKSSYACSIQNCKRGIHQHSSGTIIERQPKDSRKAFLPFTPEILRDIQLTSSRRPGRVNRIGGQVGTSYYPTRESLEFYIYDEEIPEIFFKQTDYNEGLRRKMTSDSSKSTSQSSSSSK